MMMMNKFTSCLHLSYWRTDKWLFIASTRWKREECTKQEKTSSYKVLLELQANKSSSSLRSVDYISHENILNTDKEKMLCQQSTHCGHINLRHRRNDRGRITKMKKLNPLVFCLVILQSPIRELFPTKFRRDESVVVCY
jgi:hypothetical protein